MGDWRLGIGVNGDSPQQSPQSLIPDPDAPVARLVRERGPMTVAAFMDLALYDPAHGYYARAARRSGRAGDFFSSVDVGPLFGELLEIQLAEMASLLRGESRLPDSESRFDL